ncbi:MAG: hypothetical protein II887_08330 [Bacteroidales bacterium]|nr:hypothetical protein [Bacteroidales bacterium]
MKKTQLIPVIFLSLVMMASCSKTGIEVNIHDPQHIVFIHGFDENEHILIDQDLVDAFGEEYIHFGHTPPSLEGFSFKVRGMDYDTCIRFIFNVDPTQPPIQSHTDPPTYDPSVNHHHFYNHVENISSHKIMTSDSFNDTYTREKDTVYVIGDENTHRFTAYYEEVLQEEGAGHPTNAIIFSGTVVYDDNDQFVGIKDYRIGKKILKYRERPTIPSYAEGTIEIKTHSELSPVEDWDQ